MHSTASSRIVVLVVLVLLLAAVACAPASPEERVEQARAQTTVELLSFAVLEEPVVSPDAAMEPEESAADDAEDQAVDDSDETAAAADADAAEVEPAIEMSSDVILDLLVSSDADEPLAGFTVEYEHVDSRQQVKDARRLWIETPGLLRGVGTQLSVVVDDIDYEEGDGFSVTLLTPAPEAERSEYREFRDAGDS